MIFINEAKKEIGEECLIFDYKTKKFYGNLDVQSTDIDRLYSLLKSKVNLNISKEVHDKLFLVVLYCKMEKDENAKKEYIDNFLQFNPYNSPKNDNTLHILFNIIEIENKFKLSSKERLQSLEKYLAETTSDDDENQNFLLKFYRALLNYLLGKYDASKYDVTNKIITDLIGDINDEMTNLVTTDRVKYIQIRLYIIKYQLLEQEGIDKNKEEILNELECLFGLIKLQQESFATKIGIKLYTIQAQYGMYEKCIKTLEELLTVISRQKLLGKSNMGIIEQSLYIVGLLGYYNSLTGNYAEVRRFIKKINKTLKILNEKYSSGGSSFQQKSQYETKIKEEIIPQYEFYKNMLETIVNGNDTTMKEALRKTFIDFQSFISKKNNSSDTSMEDSAILNMHILQIPGASLKESYREKEKGYKDCLDKNKSIDNNHLLPFYMYNYNVIAELFRNINNNTDRIRLFAQKIFDYTESISNKDYTKELLRLPYFKEMLNSIYFMQFYTYYYERDYNKVIELIEKYVNMTVFSYELDKHNDSYCKILKLRGDAYFQLDKYMKAIQFYEEVLGKNPDFKSCVLLFNLGLSYFAIGQKDKARNYFESAQNFNNSNQIKQDQADIANDYLEELIKKCQ